MILRDFTWFLRNFTWFLHDYTQFLRFLRDFLPGTNFLCQAPKTILHPCWQVHSPWVLWGVFAVISEIMCSWGQLLYNERGRNKEICVHYPGEGDTPSLPRTLINFHFSSLASITTSPANSQLPSWYTVTSYMPAGVKPTSAERKCLRFVIISGDYISGE